MTVSEQQTRPPDNPPPGPEWKPIPGAGYYEASHRGQVRSVDRTIGSRFHKGVVLKLREDGDGYWVVNITLDGGERKHNASVARLVLAAHDPAYREDWQACHGPGGQKDNRFPENIRTDRPEANREEALALRLERNPPKPPKPPKVCPRCGAEHTGKGRNCHDCVVGLGVTTANMLADGKPLDWIADELDYPPAGLFNLAVRHGSLRCTIGPFAGDPPSPRSWLRRVMSRREASRQISDAQ